MSKLVKVMCPDNTCRQGAFAHCVAILKGRLSVLASDAKRPVVHKRRLNGSKGALFLWIRWHTTKRPYLTRGNLNRLDDPDGKKRIPGAKIRNHHQLYWLVFIVSCLAS